LVFDQSGYRADLTLKVRVHQALGQLTEDDEESKNTGENTQNDRNDEADRFATGPQNREHDSASDRSERAEDEPNDSEAIPFDDDDKDVKNLAGAAGFFCHDVLLVAEI
jgi:hypothetical protein